MYFHPRDSAHISVQRVDMKEILSEGETAPFQYDTCPPFPSTDYYCMFKKSCPIFIVFQTSLTESTKICIMFVICNIQALVIYRIIRLNISCFWNDISQPISRPSSYAMIYHDQSSRPVSKLKYHPGWFEHHLFSIH